VYLNRQVPISRLGLPAHRQPPPARGSIPSDPLAGRRRSAAAFCWSPDLLWQLAGDNGHRSH